MELKNKLLHSGDFVSLILGSRGYGKTTLIKNLIKEVEYERKIIIIDTLDNYNHGVIIDNRINLIKFIVENEDKNFLVIYRPEKISESVFDVLINLDNYILVIDEVDLFCSSKYIDEDLSRILRHGRNNRIKLIISSRLPAEIHKQIFACSTDTFLMNNRESNALTYLGKFIDKKVIEKLPKINKFYTFRIEHDENSKISYYYIGKESLQEIKKEISNEVANATKKVGVKNGEKMAELRDDDSPGNDSDLD